MNRRDFITLLGGAAAGWPLTGRAQAPERTRRIGVLMSVNEKDEGKVHLSGFMKGLAELGWIDGRNLRTEVRWGGGDVNRIRIFAKELVALQPDVNYFREFEAAARSSKVEPIAARARNDAEIETVVTSLGGEPAGGLVVMPDFFMLTRSGPIILLAARNNVPAVYPLRFVVARDGGLLSYGPDLGDIFRRGAPYVDQILRGAKPADLPVQVPVKFEMAVNVKTAEALGLAVPPSI